MPRVLNKRKGGDRIPAGAILVDRTTKWGNPYRVGKDGTREQVIHLYELTLIASHVDLSELRGKDLVCWCHSWNGQGPNPQYCHADILLELANA